MCFIVLYSDLLLVIYLICLINEFHCVTQYNQVDLGFQVIYLICQKV